jgi:hypothetical protein
MRNYTTQTKQIIILVYLKTCFLAQRRTKRGKWALCQKSAFLKLISYNNILYSWNTVSTEMKFLDINVTTLLQAVHSRSTGWFDRNQTLFRERILGHQFDRRLVSFAPYYSQSFLLADFTENQTIFWGGILGHQFDRRIVSFAPCYSQSLLLADFTENRKLFCFKNPCIKIREQKKLESIRE